METGVTDSGTTRAGAAESGIDRTPRLLDLLEKTSRTFALTIPVLPDPTRTEVTIAYLLFRIADTLEDATLWTPQHKVAQLQIFRTWLEASVEGQRLHPSIESTVKNWQEFPPLIHDGYQELLSETAFVFEALLEQTPEARRQMVDYTDQTAERMAGYAGRTREGETLQLRDVQDLKDYCYAVAGLVGEMLTELFLLDGKNLDPVAAELRKRAVSFGEALQLVNILKDADDDASEGRRFLPAQVDRSQVFDIARKDLKVATEYVLLLQQAGAPRGFVEFTAMPVLLAQATLDRVEQAGPGSKISRELVFEVIEAMGQRLDQGDAAILD